MSLRQQITDAAAGGASLILATVAAVGPDWRTVASAAGAMVFSVAIGAGGYYLTQQGARDARQDQLLDAISTKLVDVSITLVQIQANSSDAQALALRERTIREERDARELNTYRQRADEKAGKKP